MTELRTTDLSKFIKALKGRPLSLEVGITAKSNGRSDSSTENAAIGAVHEFGTSTIPMRSFLRMPLSLYFSKKIDNSQAFDKDALKKTIAESSLSIWMEKLGEEAVGLVTEAFETNGFGNWPPDKEPHDEILVRTGQLKHSIGYEVKEA